MEINKPSFLELFGQMMSNIESGYDKIAPKFDQSEYVTPKSIILPVIEYIKSEGKQIKTGIDICCGTGAASSELVHCCDENFVAFDLSQGMLDQCYEKIKIRENEIKLECVKGNALELPFKERFDVAVSFGAFGHILEKDKSRFVENIYQCLNKGGSFYFVTTYNPNVFRWLFWRQTIFNWTMKIRNFFFSPKFIMYYLTFRLPEVEFLLTDAGFKVELFKDAFSANNERTDYLIPNNEFVLVKATKE
jgi:SAM-dependent methyltransferase